jgi:twinkle protein
MLGKARRIVLAGDNDEPGMVLREELARRLGRHRCLTVEWPEGCKDAGDVLRLHGPETVLQCVRAAQPYPIEGLQRVVPGTLRDLRRRPRPGVMTTGVSSVDELGVRFPLEGAVIVTTGYPGSGKTAFVRYVMIHGMKNYARRWAVFSPEMEPWQQFVVSCAEPLVGHPFYPETGYPTMSDEEAAQAEEWFGPRLTMIVCDSEDQTPTADWIFERARAAVLRDGTTDLLIDPVNEMDNSRPTGITETEYIGRFLQRCRAFTLRHGCNIWIIAHPAKPALKNGEAPAVPTAYAISGSAHWYNKADMGVTIYRPDLGVSEFHLWKSRHRRWGQHPQNTIMNYDPVIGRYSAPSDNFPPSGKTWNDPQ